MATTIHRCAECSHSDENHERVEGSHCSHGYCRCTLSKRHVAANNPSEEIPTFPAYDRKTGKWASRQTDGAA